MIIDSSWFTCGKLKHKDSRHKMSKQRWGQGKDCLAQRSAVVCHVTCTASQSAVLRCYRWRAWFVRDLANVTKHLVIAKIALVPLSGPRHQEAATILNAVSCNHCRADPAPGAVRCQHSNKKGIQGNEKLGKIKTGKRNFFHTNMELDSGACGKRIPLRPRI